MKVNIPFGKSTQIFSDESIKIMDLILPKREEPVTEPIQAVKDSFEHPVGQVKISLDLSIKKIGIGVNDTTRPIPNSVLFPPLLDFFHQRGTKKENISFFIASGTHQQASINENEQIFPDWIIKEYAIHRHDCDDARNLEFLGSTSRNTPIYINKDFFHKDIKIVVGNIEPHHFMGYSGGSKSAAIGLAGRETIRVNHSFLMNPESNIGSYETNPTRMDLEEIGDKIDITAALNVVLNSDKRIVKVFWGNARSVMKAGIPFSRNVCQKKVGREYDLVITSPGGYPKDINLYQSQKAITHVCQIAKEKGTIILVAECSQGLGSQEFENYLRQFSSLNAVIEAFRNMKFEIGPHKAYQLATQAVRNRIIVVSSLKPHIIRKTHLEYAPSISTAMKMAVENSSIQSVAIVPFATNTMFFQ
jgi:lactate racemase